MTYDKFKNPFAASLFLHDDETSYYSVGGVPDDRKNGSVSLNIYDQILNSIRLKNIDFVVLNLIEVILKLRFVVILNYILSANINKD